MEQLPASMAALAKQAYDLRDATQRLTSLERKLGAGTSPGSIPIGGIIDYYGTTEPAGWLFPTGQAIPAQYTTAIALIGANTPDLRGRAAVALDNMGGSDAGRLSVANTLGGSGGVEQVTLTAAQSGSPAHTHTIPKEDGQPVRNAAGTGGGFIAGYVNASFTGSSGSSTDSSVAANAASAHSIMQPYMLVNKLIRVA